MAEELRITNDTCTLTQEWISKAPVRILVDRCTDQKATPPDKLEYYQVVHLELAERSKESPEVSAELAKEVLRLLANDNSIR